MPWERQFIVELSIPQGLGLPWRFSCQHAVLWEISFHFSLAIGTPRMENPTLGRTSLHGPSGASAFVESLLATFDASPSSKCEYPRETAPLTSAAVPSRGRICGAAPGLHAVATFSKPDRTPRREGQACQRFDTMVGRAESRNLTMLSEMTSSPS